MDRNERNLYAVIQRLKKRAADKGVAPGVVGKPLPEGQALKGISTLYGPEGDIKAQWVKSNAEQAAREAAMKAFVEELSDAVKPRKPLKPPKHTQADIMCGYPIGDHHWGMLSWHPETGKDYDLKIAKKLLADAVDYLVGSAPPAEQALLVNLGDFLHGDDSTNRTRKSGHILDMDGRFAKITRAAAFGLCHTTERLLEKHKRVKVVNIRGNHDDDSANWLSTVLHAWFRNEPRVEIELSPAMYQFHRFGKNMLCMTHGDKVKLPELPQVMASLEPTMWGETTYRVGWTGHVHHAQRVIGKENRGAICESFGVLPPSDAYSASMGYHSQREMHCITFKKTGGVLCRTTFNADLS